MTSPLPRGYKNNPFYPAIDYDLKSPLPSLVNTIIWKALYDLCR